MDARAALRSRKAEIARTHKPSPSPLARFNAAGRLICILCNVPVKSASLWPAHAASRLHKAAADAFKAKAAAAAAAAAAPPAPPPAAAASSGALPERFFDAPTPARDSKRSNGEEGGGRPAKPPRSGEEAASSAAATALPKGFFDNADADSRAQGVEVVKPSIQDEYEAFQKSIEVDVAGVDVRLDEEEFQAAEDRQELQRREQMDLFERIEEHKRRQREKVAAAAAAADMKAVRLEGAEAGAAGEDGYDEDSSDDSEEDPLFVDWRAKHL